MYYDVVLYPLRLIRPSEEVSKHHVAELAAKITRCQRWITALPVERQTGIIMDGNHRYQVACKLGLGCIPCVMLDYTDKRVSVCHWHSGEPFCPEKIRQQILADGRLFPYKTTRHRFTPPLPEVEFALYNLRSVPAVNSRNYFAAGKKSIF